MPNARNITANFILVIGLIALSSLAACGFKPLHTAGTSDSVRAEYNDIYIDNIPEEKGQFLRNELIDRLYTQGRPVDPSYILKVSSIQERRTNLDITISADTTRAQLRLDTTLRLLDKETNELLMTRDIYAITSYNILQSQFTTKVSQENARNNALIDLADQIDLHLGLYFSRAE